MDVYTDGSCITGPDGLRYAGYGIWFGPQSIKNLSAKIHADNPTNQYAELLAIRVALRLCCDVDSLRMFTDSMYAINCITIWYDSWEQKGWKTSTGSEVLYSDIIKQSRSVVNNRTHRGLSTSLLHVKGHSTSIGNNGADTLARAGSTSARVSAMNNTIFFSSGVLSQFHPSPFTVVDNERELRFNCCEQWYQYKKAMTSSDDETAEQVLTSTNPMWQKSLGQRIKEIDVDTWAKIREQVVIVGNEYKFSQNPKLKEYLMSTKGKRLVEARPDKVWGIGISKDDAIKGKKWDGENLLGKCLMRVRDSMT